LKHLKMFIISTVLLFTLVACGQSEANNGDNSEDQIKIGYSINTLNNPFFVEVKKAAENAAQEKDISISFVNANNDLAKQMSGIEDLIQQKVDVLIIDPVDSKGTIPAVESANDAGIPVITTGRRVEGGEIVTHLGYDEVKNGEIAGEYLAEQIDGKGKVVELQGTLGTDVANDRSEGFHNAMNEYEDIEIVASQSADFNRTEALNVMENILQSNPNIEGLYAANDEMALGALQASSSSNKDIVIVSNDGTEEALKAIKDGNLAGTMAISPEEYGKKAVEIALAVAQGEDQPNFVELPSEFISKDNIDKK